MMKTLAVLITVHNRKEKTLECLRSLYAQLPLESYQVDVYLTDDGCTDGTPKAIRRQFPEVYIIQGDRNLFWNHREIYTALKEAAKKDDTFVYSNMFPVLFWDSHSKVGYEATDQKGFSQQNMVENSYSRWKINPCSYYFKAIILREEIWG